MQPDSNYSKVPLTKRNKMKWIPSFYSNGNIELLLVHYITSATVPELHFWINISKIYLLPVYLTSVTLLNVAKPFFVSHPCLVCNLTTFLVSSFISIISSSCVGSDKYTAIPASYRSYSLLSDQHQCRFSSSENCCMLHST